ncbi:MAG: rRNA maturation RNase YbeY [Verrucomicrobiales bacterium]|nr:MAG: rRNA maturation RNase YbeY [Verrucomicrobiales bacterium]
MAAARKSVHVTLLNRQRVRKLDSRRLRRITLALLGELRVVEAELGVTFVPDEEMTLVNETFLQHEGSTDVITFDHSATQDSRRKSTETERNALHGELFICVDEAVRQAKRFRTTWQAELARYIVHGVLHLLGHDDHGVADRRKMKREENRLVRKLAGLRR